MRLAIGYLAGGVVAVFSISVCKASALDAMLGITVGFFIIAWSAKE